MDSGKSICCVLLFQHLQKLLYSSNRQTYDAVVEVIQASFPQFSQYLEVNWFPHEALFAGFARAGVLHLDNHTNNRLERYHHTIKSVVGSSQVSVGILIDRLQKLLNVRVMSMQQAEFNQRMNRGLMYQMWWRDTVPLSPTLQQIVLHMSIASR